MDSSQLTAYRKAHMEFLHYQTYSLQRGLQQPMSLQNGARSLVENQKVVIESVIPFFVPPEFDINNSILQAFEIFLQWIVSKGLGPTATARVLYIWFMAVAAPWNWVSLQNKLSGVHDRWDFDQHSILGDLKSVFVWTNHAMVDTFSSFFPGYDVSVLIQQESSIFNWTSRQQTDFVNNVRDASNWPAFWSAWQSWAAYRNGDGSATYLTQQPTVAQVVNKNLQLQTDSPVEPAYVDPTKWTPLKLPMKPNKQGYLTYYWDDVTSTGITLAQEINMDNVADQYYVTGTARANELTSVMNITATLNDTEKVTAEFWAGGPKTVTPPGISAWFWKEYISNNSIDTPTLIFSGLDLGIHLFEGSRLTWRNKARKVQARPIQELRIMYKGQTLTSWDGASIQGELWMPYQESDFVTPPFADFPSGHSHFSQALANTMSAWFGPNIPIKPITKSDLTLLSPIFNGTGSQTNSLNTITISTGKSIIQPGIVPAAPTTLTWPTWQDLANSAGMSRLYGGIHCLSAHTSSQAVANQLHTDLNSVWGFNRN